MEQTYKNYMAKLTATEKDALEKRQEQLKEKIKGRTAAYETEIFEDLVEYFENAKRMYPSYNFTNLSVDLEMPYATVTKILAWRYASEFTKTSVESGRITRNKALTVLQRTKKPEHQKQVITAAIKNNLTAKDINKVIVEKKLDARALKKNQEMSARDNIARSILNHVDAVERALKQAKKVPPVRRVEVRSALKDHLKLVQKAIKDLTKPSKNRKW